MVKYALGLGSVIAMVVGYLVLMPAQERQQPATEPVASATAPVAPDAITRESPVTDAPDEEALLEGMAADAREDLPSVMGDTLTMTDAVFLPRMRIMEYAYETTFADTRAAVDDLRALIEGRSETICIDGREMFELGVTLRNTFLDRNGALLRRVYLLPDDCRRFY